VPRGPVVARSEQGRGGERLAPARQLHGQCPGGIHLVLHRPAGVLRRLTLGPAEGGALAANAPAGPVP
jgi:hypothetical protein